MKYIQRSVLAELYRGSAHPIDESYAELRLIRAACAGDEEGACALFREEKQFGHAPSVVDTPFRRYEGLQGVRRFIREWLPRFQAERAAVIPVIQTRANGRSVTELQVDFTSAEGIRQVPFFVVADLRGGGLLDEVRLYTHCSFIPGLQAYRAPLFPSTHLEKGEGGLLTGAVREYYEGLHHLPAADVDRIMACMADNCVFGGYEPLEPGREPALTRADVYEKYRRMAQYIPRCVAMRYETLIDDGRTCVIEWVHVVSRAGREERNRIAMSGIAAYERGEDGLLCSIRISDYAGLEGTIDWDQLPLTWEQAQQVNFVEEIR
ncbi:MAG: nuclear transport factor 2 family protein [Clostridia bacterium]|nr:nuclear transport factor 2 family protein [Clostridia bacterium]